MTVYYSPADLGLTQIAEIEWRDEPYEFDLTVLWKHADGRYFIGSDSGCSCPSPFEDFHDLRDFTQIKNLGDLLGYLVKHEAEGYGRDADDHVAMVQAYQAARAAR